MIIQLKRFFYWVQVRDIRGILPQCEKNNNFTLSIIANKQSPVERCSRTLSSKEMQCLSVRLLIIQNIICAIH